MADQGFELSAKSPCAGLLPLRIGGVTVTEETPEAITSVAPFSGQEAAVSKALKSKTGAALPEVGHVADGKAGRVIWSGRGQFMVLGPVPKQIKGAALTDQSDGWACVAIDGPGARDVLARLTPLDLRDAAFAPGQAARTLIGHMNAVVLRTGPEHYAAMVFRSMAHTLVHELKDAMETVAAVRETV